MRGVFVVDIVPVFRAGDPPPEGYLAWDEWARVQLKAGLKQRKCWHCGLWRFPQEFCHGPEPPLPPEVKTIELRPKRRRRR